MPWSGCALKYEAEHNEVDCDQPSEVVVQLQGDDRKDGPNGAGHRHGQQPAFQGRPAGGECSNNWLPGGFPLAEITAPKTADQRTVFASFRMNKVNRPGCPEPGGSRASPTAGTSVPAQQLAVGSVLYFRPGEQVRDQQDQKRDGNENLQLDRVQVHRPALDHRPDLQDSRKMISRAATAKRQSRRAEGCWMLFKMS